MLRHLIHRPVSVSMVLLVIVVLGIASIRNLAVSIIPDVEIPYINIQVSAPSMTASEIESSVVRPLRGRLMQMQGLEDMHSETKSGGAMLRLTFSHSTKMRYAYVEVNEHIDRAMGSMPKISRPLVMMASASDIPAFYVNLTLKDGVNPAKMSEMYRYARDVVVRRLEQLGSVAMVDVTGLGSEELFIRPREDAMRSLGLQLSDLESIIKTADVSLGQLNIRDGEYHFNVKFRSFIGSKTDIEEMYFSRGGRVFQLKDIADIELKPMERTGLAISDGKEAVVLAVIKKSTARMSSLKKAVNAQLGSFRRTAKEIDFTITRDQTELLDYSIENLVKNILVGVLLACLVMLFFMRDIRSSLLVAAAIPVSLLFAIIFFRPAGISINIISLSGLLMAVGMMVDSSIILTDNIGSRLQRGDNLEDAVCEGTKEVAAPMLSSVLTTCAVFIPLVFIRGIVGKLFYDQAITITLVLICSWIVTVLALPVYYYLLASKKGVPGSMKKDSGRGLMLYEKVMTFFMGHRILAWAILPVCIVVCGVCIKLMPRSKLPEISYSDMVMDLKWEGNTTLAQSRSRVLALVDALPGDDIQQLTALMGEQQFVLPHDVAQSQGQATLYFKCASPAVLDKLKGNIESYMARAWPGASFDFKAAGNIFDLVFSGETPMLSALIRPASSGAFEASSLNELMGILRTEYPGIIRDGVQMKENVMLVADPELMALYGINAKTLNATLTSALDGSTVLEIVRGASSLPVVVGSGFHDLATLLSDTFVHAGNADIPVASLMRQYYVQSRASIMADAGGEYCPLTIETAGADVPALVESIKNSVRNTGRFDVDFSGQWFSNREMLKEMIFVLAIAVLLLFLILASQFESLLQPLVIILETVIDIAMSLLGLWIAGVSVNLMSLIGIVVVCGIVVNDSILKIDTINKLRKSGYDLRPAIFEAGRRRLKAIIMTSLTTILAVCPFLARGSMGADLQYPMSLVIIIGMSAGTLVSLFIVPVYYFGISKRK